MYHVYVLLFVLMESKTGPKGSKENAPMVEIKQKIGQKTRDATFSETSLLHYVV